jgi:hypothetical protein
MSFGGGGEEHSTICTQVQTDTGIDMDIMTFFTIKKCSTLGPETNPYTEL